MSHFPTIFDPKKVGSYLPYLLLVAGADSNEPATEAAIRYVFTGLGPSQG